MNKNKLLCIFSVCFITACAPPPQTPVEGVTEQPPNTLSATTQSNHPEAIKSWDISGAMAARSSKKSWSASVNWLQQGPEHYQIRLSGPLGGGAVMIEKSGGDVSFIDGPKKTSSKHPEALLEQQTGIRLPVNSLYYWVRGIPAPGAVSAVKKDPAGHLVSLSQAGYAISYSNYTTINHVDLPGKIQLQGRGLSLKFVIQHWKI